MPEAIASTAGVPPIDDVRADETQTADADLDRTEDGDDLGERDTENKHEVDPKDPDDQQEDGIDRSQSKAKEKLPTAPRGIGVR